MGRNQEAVDLNARGVRLFKEVYGARSPYVAHALSNRGEYLLTLGANGDALASFREALSILEAADRRDPQFIAYPLTGLGRALLALGRPTEALPPLERAAQIRDAGADAGAIDASLKAETTFPLAQVLWATGQRALAQRRAVTAEGGFRQDPTRQKDADDVRTWLARHAGRQP